MSERSVIFALLTDKPPNGKLPVLGVYSFDVFLNQRKRKNDHRDIFMIKLKERVFQRLQAASLTTELSRPIFVTTCYCNLFCCKVTKGFVIIKILHNGL